MNIGINIPEYEVTQFNRLFKDIVETNFNYLRIRGEISEIKNASSGHIYLTLKDDNSVLNATIWNQKKNYLQIKPEVGMEVIVTGKISTYAKSISTYSINIDKLELAGEGALLKLIEERKNRLKSRGFFDEKNKKKLPYIPKKIGVITSTSGSVIHDIINRVKDRFPIDIDIWSVAVQGANAADNIIEAIIGFNLDSYIGKPDIIIIARGGGSIEDLMPFNDEKLAITVFNSKIPIVSAIGHETDTTIVDYVSDLRVSTPTAAAEKSVPMRNEINQEINNLSQKLIYYIENYFENINQRLFNLSRLLKAPNFIIQTFNEKFQFTINNLFKTINSLMEQKLNKLENLNKLLRSPQLNYQIKKDYLVNLTNTINQNIYYKAFYQRKELNKFTLLLKANSTFSILNKGYSIVSKSKKIIKNSQNIKNDDAINIQFSDKSIYVKIKKIN